MNNPSDTHAIPGISAESRHGSICSVLSPCFLEVLVLTRSLKELCNDQISGDYSAPFQFFIQGIGMRGINAASARLSMRRH